MIWILLTTEKSAAIPLAERTEIELKVAERPLSLINQKLIVNPRLENKNLVPITYMQHYIMLTY